MFEVDVGFSEGIKEGKLQFFSGFDGWNFKIGEKFFSRLKVEIVLGF